MLLDLTGAPALDLDVREEPERLEIEVRAGWHDWRLADASELAGLLRTLDGAGPETLHARHPDDRSRETQTMGSATRGLTVECLADGRFRRVYDPAGNTELVALRVGSRYLWSTEARERVSVALATSVIMVWLFERRLIEGFALHDAVTIDAEHWAGERR